MISIEAYQSAIANADIRQSKVLARKSTSRYHCIGVRWCLVIAVLLLIGCVEANPGPGAEQNYGYGNRIEQVIKIFVSLVEILLGEDADFVEQDIKQKFKDFDSSLVKII